MEAREFAPTDTEDEFPATTFTIQTLIQTEAEFVGIDRAIEALQNGTYGSCEVCDISIPAARLRTDPALVRCDAHVVRETPELFADGDAGGDADGAVDADADVDGAVAADVDAYGDADSDVLDVVDDDSDAYDVPDAVSEEPAEAETFFGAAQT